MKHLTLIFLLALTSCQAADFLIGNGKLTTDLNANLKSINGVWDVSLTPQDGVGANFVFKNEDGHILTIGDGSSAFLSIDDTHTLGIGNVNATGDVQIEGNTNVFGVFTAGGSGLGTANSITITGADIRFEGSTVDTNETILSATNATADRAIVLPDASGTLGFGTIGGATGSADNLVLRANGTGGVTIQGSAVTIDDFGAISGVSDFTATGLVSAGSIYLTGGASVLGAGYFVGGLTVDAPFIVHPQDGSGTTYAFQNPTGDDLEIDADGVDVIRMTGTGSIYAASLVQAGSTSFGAANSVFMQSGGVTFEGATVDAFETTIAVTDPTADRTVTIPNITGTVGVMSSNSTVIGGAGFTVDGAGSTVTTGQKGYFIMPFAGTITGWNIAATGTSPTCTIDVWKIATGTALPTVLNTITASAKPALATGNAIRSSTLTSWTTSIAAGDIIGFNVDAVSAATRITFSLEIRK